MQLNAIQQCKIKEGRGRHSVLSGGTKSGLEDPKEEGVQETARDVGYKANISKC